MQGQHIAQTAMKAAAAAASVKSSQQLNQKLRQTNRTSKISSKLTHTATPFISVNAALVEAPSASVNLEENPIPPARYPQQQDSIPSTPSTSFITTAPVQFKFIVPTSLVGVLLRDVEGTEPSSAAAPHTTSSHPSSLISNIKQATGALVQFSRPGAASLNKVDRLMILSGQTVESCTSALTYLLLEIVPTLDPNYDRMRSYFRNSNNNNNTSSGNYNNTSNNNNNNTTGMLTLRLVIPSNCAGKVMGPGGEQIKSLSESTGTSVIVESRLPNAAFTPFRVVSILAPTALSLNAAMLKVMETVSEDEVRYFSGIKEITSVCFEIVPVPAGKVGVLLGPEGRHIKALQDVLRVKLGIALNNNNSSSNSSSDNTTKRKKNTPTTTSSTTTTSEKVKYVSIWGPPTNVKVAKDAILVATGGYKHTINSNSSNSDVENAMASRPFTMHGDDHMYIDDDI